MYEKNELENMTLDELMNINKKLTKTMNERIRTFEKAGMSSYALQLMQDFLGKENLHRFSNSKKLGKEYIVDQIFFMQKVKTYQTSTIRGERLHQKRLLKSLGMTELFQDQKALNDFSTFLSSDIWKEYKMYDSERIYEVEETILNKKNSLENLQSKWDEYKKGLIDLDEVIDEWVDVDDKD